MNRSAELEMMDLPGQPRELLAGNLRDLRILNRYLGSYRSVLGGLARLVREQSRAPPAGVSAVAAAPAP